MEKNSAPIDLLAGLLAPGGPGPSFQPPRDEQWSALAREARVHRLESYLLHRLSGLGLADGVPAAVAAGLRGAARRDAARGVRLANHLARILGECRERRLQAVALKGACLGPLAYGDLGLRPMDDIDLLVRREELPRWEELAGTLGYTPFLQKGRTREWYAERHFHLVLRGPALPCLELHWELAPPGAPLHGWAAELLEASVPTRIAGETAAILAPADLILHLAHHACSHHFRGGIRPFLDLALVLAGAGDFTGLAGLAANRNMADLAAAALGLVAALFGPCLPPGAQAAAGSPPIAIDRLCSYVKSLSLDYENEIPAALQTALAPGSPWDRAARALRSIFPSLAEIRRIYSLPRGSHRAQLLRFLRPFDLIRRRGGWLSPFHLASRRGREALSRSRTRAEIRTWLEGRGLAEG